MQNGEVVGEELILVKAGRLLVCVQLYALARLLLTTPVLIRRHAHQLGK